MNNDLTVLVGENYPNPLPDVAPPVGREEVGGEREEVSGFISGHSAPRLGEQHARLFWPPVRSGTCSPARPGWGTHHVPIIILL